MSSSEQVPVAIAGGGVVGITLALMLARRGVASVVLERELEPHRLPRAHAVNPRTIEILRELGITDAELRGVGAPKELTSEVRFVTTLTGYCFGTLPYERQDDDVRAVTPSPLVNIPQPALEALLLERVESEPLIDLRRGHVWVSAEQEDEGVTSAVRTPAGPAAVRSRYLVAADGASSAVREHLGIGMWGLEEVATAVSITFTADLTEFVRTRPGVLHWIFGPAQKGTLLAYLPDRLWTYAVVMPPGLIDMTAFSDERVEELIRAALGPEAAHVPFEVIAVTPWTMRAQVAEAYRAGDVLLAGDAAHRFPPTGGLGLNSGMQDAHNLAWKLAAVLDGWAADGLLDTYERERQPIARRCAEQSLLNGGATLELEFLAEGAALESDGDGLAAWLGEPGRVEQIRDAIELQRPHFDSLALQLGFSYDPEDDPITDVTAFSPRAAAGRRLPHGWLSVDGERVSVLDLLDPDGFTLLLLDGAEVPALPAGVPTTPVRLDPADPDVRRWAEEVGLTDVAAVLVRPDGHVHRVAADSAEVERFGADIAALVCAAELTNLNRPEKEDHAPAEAGARPAV